MTIRVRFKQCLSLQDRLSAWADQARKQASTLPAGSERDRFLRKSPPGRDGRPCRRMGQLPRITAAEVVPPMRDMQAKLNDLIEQAAECSRTAARATDKAKQELFARLAQALHRARFRGRKGNRKDASERVRS